jgi:hypothetical protein
MEKKEKKRKTKDKSSVSSSLDLSSFLNWGFLNHPKQLFELPLLISTLDSGQYVELKRISNDSLRSYLSDLMQFLPVEYLDGKGWLKNSSTKSISGFMLKEMINLKSIKQPNDLDYSERLSSTKPPIVLHDILLNFPSIKNEFSTLIENLLDGNAVQLNDIEDEEIRKSLENFFISIELEYSKLTGYAVPDEKKKKEIVLKTLKLFLNIFLSEQRIEKIIGNKSNDEQTIHKNEKTENFSSSASSSESSDKENDSQQSFKKTKKTKYCDDSNIDFKILNSNTGNYSDNEKLIKIEVIGPQMPTFNQFKILQQNNNNIDNINNDDDDDDIGPKQENKNNHDDFQFKKQTLQPLGFIGFENNSDEIINNNEENNISNNNNDVIIEENKNSFKREEWMMKPGDSKILAG